MDTRNCLTQFQGSLSTFCLSPKGATIYLYVPHANLYLPIVLKTIEMGGKRLAETANPEVVLWTLEMGEKRMLESDNLKIDQKTLEIGGRRMAVSVNLIKLNLVVIYM